MSEGDEAVSWLDSNDNLNPQEQKSLEKFREGPHLLAKSYLELEKSHRSATEENASLKKSGLFAPGDDATDEDRAAFHSSLYTHLGRPANPSDYVIAEPDNLPEGMTWDPDYAEAIKEIAFEAGCSQEKLDKVMGANTEALTRLLTKQQEAKAAAREEATAELKKLWGKKDFDARVEGTRRVLDKWEVDGLAGFLKESGMGDDPRFIRFLDKIYRDTMAEGRHSGTETGRSTLTKDETFERDFPKSAAAMKNL